MTTKNGNFSVKPRRRSDYGFLAIASNDGLLNCGDIKKLIPHRWPMLLIRKARYLSITPDIIVTEKTISRWDLLLFGHFPKKKIYPGVLLLEIMAQSGAILVKKKFPDIEGLPFFREVSGKFLFQVVPGDRLTTIITLVSGGKPNRPYIFSGEIRNQHGKVVCKSDELKGYLAQEK